jgi:hypothetical protein
MKNFAELNKENLLLINGGDEYTYNKGYEVGEFFGKLFGMLDRFIETIK